MEYGKRILSLLLALAMVFTMLPTPAFAEGDRFPEEEITEELPEEAVLTAEEPEAEPAEEPEAVPEEMPEQQADETGGEMILIPYDAPMMTMTDTGSLDTDAMVYGYLRKGGGNGKPFAIEAAGANLHDMGKALYKAGKQHAALVANGDESSTWFSVNAVGQGYADQGYSAAELGVPSLLNENGYISDEAVYALNEKLGFDPSAIGRAILADCAYEVYWRDTGWTYYSAFSEYGISEQNGELYLHATGDLRMAIHVSEDYRLGNKKDCTADTVKTKAVAGTIQKVDAIVNKYAGKSNYEKLCGYRDEICALNTYNDEAAAGGVPYGNPWQLIWVFDGDPTTNVVCEGYSKALQYLWERSNISQIQVYSVTGYMASSNGGGGDHMWNIAHMEDGNNYLIDVTNVDNGTIGYPDKLFMKAPASGSVTDGYIFNTGYANVGYFYDDDTLSDFTTAQLTICNKNYTPPVQEADPSGVCGDNLTWVLDKTGTLTITGTGAMYDYSASRPMWSQYSQKIKAVVLPEGLTTIGAKAFWNCTYISSVTFPASLTSIGASGLAGCVGITSMIFAGNAPTLGKDCFVGILADAVVPCTASGWNAAFGDYGGKITWLIAHPTASVKPIVAVEPTCTEDGVSAGSVCEACGTILEGGEVLPAGHKGPTLREVEAIPATCTEDGVTAGVVCDVCHEILEGCEVIPAGHPEASLRNISVVPATCTEDGKTAGVVCDACGEILEGCEVIPAGHPTDSRRNVPAVPATCTEDGKTAGIVCDACGEVLEGCEVIPAGHPADSRRNVPAVPATCTEDGKTAGVICDACGEILEGCEVLPAGHPADSRRNVPAVPATCTEDGKTAGVVCDACGEILEGCEVIPAGHPEAALKEIPPVEATCTEDGSEGGVMCTACGETVKAPEIVPALGHDFVGSFCSRCGTACEKCGDALVWTVENGTLTITGTGAMYDYEPGITPWAAETIEKAEISPEVTYLGSNAFADLSGLKLVVFTGDAPAFGKNVLPASGCAVQYPCTGKGWAEAAAAYPGAVWEAQHPGTEPGSDSENHFRRCTNPDCDYVTEVEPHTYDDVWHSDADGHWHECTVCAFAGPASVHTPDRAEPTLTDPVLCTDCGYELQGRLAFVTIHSAVSELQAGKSVTLTASVTGTDSPVQWSLAPGSEEFAEIDAVSGKLTAKQVAEACTVTVIASAGEGVTPDQVEILIYPTITSLDVYRMDSWARVSEITLDVNSTEAMSFIAYAVPEDARGGIVWTTSDVNGAFSTFETSGNVCTISGLKLDSGKTVSFTLTAAAQDDSDVTASVAVTLVGAPEEINVEMPEGFDYVLRGGTSMAMKAALKGSNITDKAVVWSLGVEDAAFASISASGKLTTRQVFKPVTIHVTVMSKQYPDCGTTFALRIVPAVVAVAIQSPVKAEDGVIAVSPATRKIQLTAQTFPGEVKQGGTWKSSSARIATVKDGLVTFNQNGQVKITYTAGDGSKKSASVTLRCGNPVTSITITGTDTLVSGQKTTLKAEINGDASFKTLVWSSDSPAVKVSKGVITAQTVYAETKAVITAAASDGSGVKESFTVTVQPKANTLGIFLNGKAVNNQTVNADISDVLTLTASEDVNWSSSKPAVADVRDGSVTIGSMGTAVLKATSLDGKQSAKVTVKISVLTKSLTISAPDGVNELIGKGKLALKAEIMPTNVSSKALTWTVSDPAAASVSASGVVTAKSGVFKDTKVVVTATARDGSGVSGSIAILVRPAASAVEIRSAESLITADGLYLAGGAVLSGRTVKVDVERPAVLTLSSSVYPFDSTEFDGSKVSARAGGLVRWSSSNSRLAAITENGDGTVTLELKGTGNVTITAAATDGSNKKATLKLSLVRYAKAIYVENANTLSVHSGKTLALKCKPLGLEPDTVLTGKTLQYSLRAQDAAFAKVSSSGVITAARGLTEPRSVVVTVSLKENPNIRRNVNISILP